VVIGDTSVWIDYFGGIDSPGTKWMEQHAATGTIGLLDLTVCEILQGVGDELTSARLLRDLREYHILTSGGMELAVQAASNYRALCRRGRTVLGTIDCLIATFCLFHGHTLLHNDRDFDVFEQELGLSVLHP
jgi:predicted nucleic acid-binding protein